MRRIDIVKLPCVAAGRYVVGVSRLQVDTVKYIANGSLFSQGFLSSIGANLPTSLALVILSIFGKLN